MRRLADVDLNDVGSIVGWLVEQWWAWVIVGVIVILVLIGRFLPDAKLKASQEFSTTDAEANEIALGLLQISNLPSGLWNDPKASLLGDRMKKTLADQWDVPTREAWLEGIERLATMRRRREPWVRYLTVRARLAERLRRTPTTKEWLAAIAEEGGDQRDARAFVGGIGFIEKQTRKQVGKDIIAPDVFVKTLDGYALGQAVAMATWGVALGHGDVAEARRIIHQINVDGRPAFSSWADFGLSYIAGRVMHWSDGKVDEKAFEKFGDGCANFKSAASTKREGPWTTLGWSR